MSRWNQPQSLAWMHRYHMIYSHWMVFIQCCTARINVHKCLNMDWYITHILCLINKSSYTYALMCNSNTQMTSTKYAFTKAALQVGQYTVVLVMCVSLERGTTKFGCSLSLASLVSDYHSMCAVQLELARFFLLSHTKFKQNGVIWCSKINLCMCVLAWPVIKLGAFGSERFSVLQVASKIKLLLTITCTFSSGRLLLLLWIFSNKDFLSCNFSNLVSHWVHQEMFLAACGPQSSTLQQNQQGGRVKCSVQVTTLLLVQYITASQSSSK